jgi:plasmid stabilization system protein ParE
MALEVIWSPSSLNNLEEVIQYLRKNWSHQVVKDFIIRMDSVVQLISEHPQIFRQVSINNSVREAVITKHNLLLYRITQSRILILAVFDTRQHPRKKKYS